MEISRNNFIANLVGTVTGPKYDGKYLSSLVKGLLNDLTLKQTLTDVLIPTFDIKYLQPVIFSTNDVRMIFTSDDFGFQLAIKYNKETAIQNYIFILGY